MRISLIALVAAAALCSAAGAASACSAFGCYDYPVADDMYPPGNPTVSPSVAMAVAARQGLGLAQAGFYNDPEFALASVGAPPPPGWGGHGYYGRHRGYAHPHAY